MIHQINQFRKKRRGKLKNTKWTHPPTSLSVRTATVLVTPCLSDSAVFSQTLVNVILLSWCLPRRSLQRPALHLLLGPRQTSAQSSPFPDPFLHYIQHKSAVFTAKTPSVCLPAGHPSPSSSPPLTTFSVSEGQWLHWMAHNSCIAHLSWLQTKAMTSLHALWYWRKAPK